MRSSLFLVSALSVALSAGCMPESAQKLLAGRRPLFSEWLATDRGMAYVQTLICDGNRRLWLFDKELNLAAMLPMGGEKSFLLDVDHSAAKITIGAEQWVISRGENCLLVAQEGGRWRTVQIPEGLVANVAGELRVPFEPFKGDGRLLFCKHYKGIGLAEFRAALGLESPQSD